MLNLSTMYDNPLLFIGTMVLVFIVAALASMVTNIIIRRMFRRNDERLLEQYKQILSNG